ncbi:hypothetical protein EUGRSUZ_E02873 [Eucalyptus grandis]|uniref:Uncharacterized protein n=2 Tax=Eucalyptus grandis TaxID=71139 RepID=A0ACC3KY37_EUCGR|nr:hypothetical protein EUGRSUZ_E02873 [Eucalyptus grandis]
MAQTRYMYFLYKTRGCQRTEMKRIENEGSRPVTFSKHKSSIYKKEMLSSAGNPFCFAHPSIGTVANQFLDQNPLSHDRSHAFIESYNQVQIDEHNQQYDELVNQIKSEKTQGKVLKRLTEGKSHGAWWEAPIEELNLKELNQRKVQMEDLRQSMRRSTNQRTRGEASTSFQGWSSS